MQRVKRIEKECSTMHFRKIKTYDMYIFCFLLLLVVLTLIQRDRTFHISTSHKL